MTSGTHDTEPIIQCNDGTTRNDLTFGALTLHDFAHSTGVQQIVAEEFSIFLLGSGVTVTDVWEGQRQRQHTYGAGNIIFLPARSEVRAAYVSNAYSETMVRIPSDILTRVASDVVNLDALDIRYCHFDDIKAQFGVTAAVRNIARANVDAPAMPLLIESMTTALCAGVICGLSVRARDKLHGMSPGLSDRRLRMTLDYIEANLTRDVTLAEIAGAAALSQYHFVRSFKAAMGVSPVRYVWQRRIELARRMLRDREQRLVDVALACGFASQSHFTTAFKQATGTTPAAWRRAA